MPGAPLAFMAQLRPQHLSNRTRLAVAGFFAYGQQPTFEPLVPMQLGPR
jgi:hypothetical protein